MATIIQMRRGTAAAWTSANTLLAEGEWGLETDTKFYKIGDGSTTWNSLSYSRQSITISGDLTGSGTTTISLVLNNSGVTAGTYNNNATTVTPFTVDIKGRVTGTGTPVTIAPVLTGDVTSSSNVTSIASTIVTGKVLTNFSVGSASAIAATDSILTAFQKIQASLNAVGGAFIYKGAWNASTNSPSITSGVGTTGWAYKVSVAGTTTIDGNSSWNINDFLIFDGTTWDKFDGEATEVGSVFGRTGTVVAQTGDYTVAQVTGAAPLASPPLTGTPTGPTASVNTNTTQLATTAFVLGQTATVTPLIDSGSGGVGTSTLNAKQDHYHPTDTSRLSTSGTAANSSLLVSMAPTTAATASTIAERDSSGNLTANEFIGSGAGLTSNTVPVGSLATTGTPSATTFLNGAGAFITPVSGFSRIAVADVNYTITVTTATILAYSSITAARTLTLPAATTSGQLIWVVDESGALSSTLSLTIQRAGTDTIEGQTSYVLTGQYAALCLSSNGAGKWTILTYEELPIAVADTNYVIPFREDLIVQVNSLTASRTITLPAANTSGQRITVQDFSGACNQTKTIIVTAAGTDTINGGISPFSLSVGYASITLVSNGAGKWSCVQNSSYVATVNSFTEYAYNTSTTTTNDTTSFGYGVTGISFQAFAPTGTNSISKTIQWLTPLQSTDLLTIEVWNGNGWISNENVGLGYYQISGTSYGMLLNITSSTQVIVNFYSSSIFNPWTVIISAGYKWRVRKVSQGNFAQGSPSYSTTIGNASSTSFTVTHNLGTPIYSVSAWETTGSLRQITSGVVISNPTSTTVTLTFTTAPALNAVQVLVQSNGGTSSNNDRLSNLANAELTISAAATASTAQWNRCYATSTAYALTLPPVLANAGKIVGVRIDSSSTYNVTVTGNSTDLIDGSNTYLMIPKECCEFKSDGTTWQRISNNTVDGSWVPVPTSLTVVGTPTYTGKFKKSGNLIAYSMEIASTTSTAATVGSTHFTLPIPCIGFGSASVVNNVVSTQYAGGVTYTAYIDVPTWAACSDILVMGSYFCG